MAILKKLSLDFVSSVVSVSGKNECVSVTCTESDTASDCVFTDSVMVVLAVPVAVSVMLDPFRDLVREMFSVSVDVLVLPSVHVTPLMVLV